jgi:hypothetical protein
MKLLTWSLSLLTGVSCLMLFSSSRPALSAEEDPSSTGGRIQRLEQRINQLAERQEQMLRRLGGVQEQQLNPPMNMPQERQGPMVSPRPENSRRALAEAEKPALVVAKANQHLHDLLGLMMLVWLVCNILLAVWIFTDIRKRGEGPGIFIALALVAGIPTAIIYSLVRIGDKASLVAK